MNALKITLPLGVAALIASLVIGYSSITLASSAGVECGSAFGGGTGTLDTVVERDCAPIVAEKDSWATSLLFVGLALLFSSALIARTNPDELANLFGPGSRTPSPPGSPSMQPPAYPPAVQPPAPPRREPVAPPAPRLPNKPAQRPRTKKRPASDAKAVELPLNLQDQVLVDYPEDKYHGMLGTISEVTETVDDYLFSVTFDIGSRHETHAYWSNELKRVD